MSKKPLLTLLSSAALSAVAALSVPISAVDAASSVEPKAVAKHTNNLYIVRLAELPAVAYQGTIQGLAATKPKKGEKLDPEDPQVVRYKSYLDARHDAVLASVGGGKKRYDYGYTYNGFAAELSDKQVAELRSTKGVVSVTKDELLQVDTSSTPAFLGLAGNDGFWATTGAKGEDIVIGMVDSGIWPEHPSFTDRNGANGNGSKNDKLAYQNMPHWKGKCIGGEEFHAQKNCNQKLIGARYYNSGWGGNAGIDELFPFEFNSPRDWGGHGTHTSSTAGGNEGVQATGPTAPFGKISGIAPRARISTYKVCWADQPTGGGCFGSDSVAAIDQAVADGVDVINFSISGTQTNFLDQVEVAFLYAADAGVFVAASAGNSGPNTGTVAHPSPWITTVAAGTHNRNGEGSVTLGNGSTINGASFANPVGPAPLIHSIAAGVAGADAATLALCYGEADLGPARLDPAKVAGKIVVCERGGNALVNKSANVAAAGGVGMILANTPSSATTQLALVHSVPTVHTAAADFPAIAAYAAMPGATATINQSQIVLNTPAPLTASFSSRGPSPAATGDILKPDLIAPGQDILAGVAPPANSGRLFDLYSGTSMSSPHVAGLAALFKQAHPDWSPMAIKSALMTTGYDVLDGGTPAPNTNPVLIFRQGAGHVDPRKALDPGLVYDAGWNDWLAFLCGTTTGVSTATCDTLKSMGYSTDPSDLNLASIAIGDLPGTQTVSRKVRNVGTSTASYNASLSGMVGFTVTVSPASLTLKPGETGSYSVTFTRSTATLAAFAGGQLTWSDGTHSVRSPIVVRPVVLGVPTSASGSYPVKFGYTGPFTATARGLVPSTVDTGSVSTGGSVDYVVNVPAGTTYARFAMFDAEVSPASDLDLEVYNSAGALVASSGSGTSTETANLSSPAAGAYTVRVVGFATGAGPASFKLHSFVLGSTAAGNMTVTAPASATLGTTGTIEIATSGLVAGTRYLGSVVYGGVAGLPGSTIITINP